ncbi:ParB/RepB/Spo0J family partition protein [Roseomonas genomospecies 6]|uniref:ParB/RepB/Spo0J family partition protein n=1 Tax=Roseomonas genomospecies 6 TaxID=214106 RepID=A0A9W7NJ08_9PROT|nr:ParB/RepB/Spo0J family partition protein [Roseomonas genomospecies 6]KAA0680033.1 ParB/RepB/Spo0J family partition protein [Roseomonas genomospecies 6]
MARKLDTSNAGLFKRALSRTGSGGGSNAALFGLSGKMRHREIPLDQVEPNPDQPRRNARGADIAALAASIGERGLLQPINVREVAPDRFQIVAGERRYWAYRSLERETIPALVIDTDDVQALALIENAQRVDLHPIDLAMTLARLIGDKGLTQDQAAVLIGKSQEYVARLLGILRLPARILDEAPDQPAVSVSLLMELAELPDEDAQLALWARAGHGLTVKEVRGAKQERKAARPDTPSVAPVLRALRSNVGKMHNLKASGHALAEEQRRELRELRDAIDALLRN